MKGGLAATSGSRLALHRRGGGSLARSASSSPATRKARPTNGTAALLEWTIDRRACVSTILVGEPTSVGGSATRSRSAGAARSTAKSRSTARQGHVAYPHLADNPIRPLVALLTAPGSTRLDDGNDGFQPSNLEVTSIDVGNPAANVIPGEVRLVFNVRFSDLWTPESLKAEIARRIAAARGGARATLTFEPTNALAFLTRPGPFTDLIAAAVEDVTGRRPALSTGGGTSDARFIKNACPVIELGLVNATIHAVDERVGLDDLEALSLIYERAFERYFAEFGA